MVIATEVDALPGGGQSAGIVVAERVVAVRVGDRACLAHPAWMTREQLQQLATVSTRLLDAWPEQVIASPDR